MVSKTIKYIRFTPCALPSSDTSKNKIKPLTSFLTNLFKQWETIKIKKNIYNTNKKLYNSKGNYMIQMNIFKIQMKIIQYKCKIIQYKLNLYNTNKKKLVIINEK